MKWGYFGEKYAPERTRTSNPLREQRSKRCAYANSATGANIFVCFVISQIRKIWYTMCGVFNACGKLEIIKIIL